MNDQAAITPAYISLPSCPSSNTPCPSPPCRRPVRGINRWKEARSFLLSSYLGPSLPFLSTAEQCPLPLSLSPTVKQVWYHTVRTNHPISLAEWAGALHPHFQCGSGSKILRNAHLGVDPGSRFRVLVTKNVTKKIPAGKSFYYFIKKCNYLSLGLRTGRPSCRRSFQPSKEKIQHFKHEITQLFSIFVGYLCTPGSGSSPPKTIWIRLRIRNTDQTTAKSLVVFPFLVPCCRPIFATIWRWAWMTGQVVKL